MFLRNLKNIPAGKVLKRGLLLSPAIGAVGYGTHSAISNWDGNKPISKNLFNAAVATGAAPFKALYKGLEHVGAIDALKRQGDKLKQQAVNYAQTELEKLKDNPEVRRKLQETVVDMIPKDMTEVDPAVILKFLTR